MVLVTTVVAVAGFVLSPELLRYFVVLAVVVIVDSVLLWAICGDVVAKLSLGSTKL